MTRPEPAKISRWQRTIQKIKALFRYKHAFLVVALFVYAGVAFYYMAAPMTQCDSGLYGLYDNTIGPIWRYDNNSSYPNGGPTLNANYPYGEQLDQPVLYSVFLQDGLHWLFSKVTGSAVCGFNMLNYVGYVFSAFVMCAFVYWLIRKKTIALLAGYLFAFAPYFQLKIGGHPTYGYEGLFVLLLWLLLLTWYRARWLWPGLLGITIAALCYMDSYFILLGGVLGGASLAGLAWFAWFREKQDKAAFMPLLKRLLAALGVGVVLLLPLAYVRLHFSKQIDDFVNSTRPNVMAEAQIYSNRPFEYIVPSPSNRVIPKTILSHLAVNRHQSNGAEYNVGLSLTMLITIVASTVIIVRKRGKVAFTAMEKATLCVCGVVLAAAFVFALPPHAHGLKLPTYYLTKYVGIWRVYSRLFVVINLVAIIAFAVLLAKVASLVTRRWLKVVVAALLFVLIFIEYFVRNPFGLAFDYHHDIPAAYYHLKSNSSIQAIVEYPLEEPPESTLAAQYITAQPIDGKKLINASLPDSPQASLRFALRDISDPQTIPVLRALGADALVFNGQPIPANELNSLRLIDSSPATRIFPATYVYKILPGPKDETAVYMKTNILTFVGKDGVGIKYYLANRAKLGIIDIKTGKDLKGRTVKACFDAEVEKRPASGLTVGTPEGQHHYELYGDHFTHIAVTTQGPLTLTMDNGDALFLDNLGCTD